MSEDQIAAVHFGVIASLAAAAGLPATATVDDLIAWIRERRAEDWQPIETFSATSEEQPVDLWCIRKYNGTGYRVTECYTSDTKWLCSDSNGIRYELNPTHWRPIPKGPKA